MRNRKSSKLNRRYAQRVANSNHRIVDIEGDAAEMALETLGLKAVEARLENLLEQASKKEPSYADFLG